MISPVSQPPTDSYTPSQPTQPTAPPQKPQPKEDTVQISEAAKATSGNAEQEGESH